MLWNLAWGITGLRELGVLEGREREGLKGEIIKNLATIIKNQEIFKKNPNFMT